MNTRPAPDPIVVLTALAGTDRLVAVRLGTRVTRTGHVTRVDAARRMITFAFDVELPKPDVVTLRFADVHAIVGVEPILSPEARAVIKAGGTWTLNRADAVTTRAYPAVAA